MEAPLGNTSVLMLITYVLSAHDLRPLSSSLASSHLVVCSPPPSSYLLNPPTPSEKAPTCRKRVLRPWKNAPQTLAMPARQKGSRPRSAGGGGVRSGVRV